MSHTSGETTRLDHLLSQLPQYLFEFTLDAGLDRDAWTLRHANAEAAALDAADRDRLGAFLREHARAGVAYRQQCQLALPRLGDRRLDCRAEPAAEADGPPVWRAVVTDLTPLTDAAAQQRLLDAELARVHERLELAIKAGKVGIWEANLATDEYVFNEQMHEIYGIGPDGYRSNVPPGTFAGNMQDWLTVIHPDDVPHVVETLRKVLSERAFVEYEHRILTHAGETRYVRSAAQIVLDQAGVPERAIGTTLDVTESHCLTNALRREKERATMAAKAGGIGLWEIDFTDDRFIWDDQMHQIYGLEPGTFSGYLKDWIPLIHPDDLDHIMEAWTRVAAEGGTLDTEVRIVRPSGEVRYVHVLAQALSKPDGSPFRAYGANWDVTRDRQLTEALRVEKERLALATHASGVGIWEQDLVSQQVLWDERMHEMFAGVPHFRSNVPPNTYHGTADGYYELVHPDDLPTLQAGGVRVAAGAESVDAEYRVRTGEGWRHIRSLGRVIRDDRGAPIRIVGTNWDITAERETADAMRRAKEAAEEAERAKSEFLAVMSHEIRTPMNTVLGMTRLALQTELTPRQRNYLTKIDLSARSLIAILNDVLDFSKIEAGKMALEETAFTLESVLESVATVTAMKAEEKDLEIAFSVEPGVPSRVIGDPLRVGQVLINLVNNAVKFTDHGEVVVSIGLDGPVEPQEARLRVSVRDTGIGLEPGQVAALFQPFAQTERHISRKYGGTGLGLAICRQLVELMGGRIWANGELGRGSTFTFTLPVKLPQDATTRLDPAALPGLANRRVLVVDDNASAREILALMVRRFGMVTTVAGSGVSALAELKHASEAGSPFELVLMDWRMPEMDGLEAARRIKTDPNLRTTPAILMVTAFGREEILRRAEQLHLDGVLIKPVTDSVMFNTIANVLGYARSEQDVVEPPPRLEPPPSVEGSDGLSLSGRRVLVVDDNALNREVAMDLLLAVGMQVDTAVHGLDAVRRVHALTYDIVLMDVHMPVMDGLSAAREIRKEPRLRSLPIVALTAQAQSIDREASFAAGMNAHLTKPIDQTQLYDTIRHVLKELEAATPPPATADASSRTDLGATATAPLDTPNGSPAGEAATSPSSSDGNRARASAASADAADAEANGLADAAVELPLSMPGLNLTAALNALGGRRALLLRLLRSFARDFEDAPARLAEANRAGRRDDIAMLAHTVKSAAAYLGAADLSEAAALLEDSARRGADEAMAERVLVFGEYLDVVLRGLRDLFTRTSRTDAPRASAAPDARAVLALIATVEPLVARGDYAAVATLDEIGARLAGTPVAALAEAARNQFEEIELDAATASLRRLRDVLDGGLPS